MGLIKCGTVVIPFDNQISKDSNLYKLYNTNIHERIEEMKSVEQIQDINNALEEKKESGHSMGTFLG